MSFNVFSWSVGVLLIIQSVAATFENLWIMPLKMRRIIP